MCSLRCTRNSAAPVHSSSVMPSAWMAVRQISRTSSLQPALIRSTQYPNSVLEVMCSRKIRDTKGLQTISRNRCIAAPAWTPKSAWLWSIAVCSEVEPCRPCVQQRLPRSSSERGWCTADQGGSITVQPAVLWVAVLLTLSSPSLHMQWVPCCLENVLS
jgi:hypothetical protein